MLGLLYPNRGVEIRASHLQKVIDQLGMLGLFQLLGSLIAIGLGVLLDKLPRLLVAYEPTQDIVYDIERRTAVLRVSHEGRGYGEACGNPRFWFDLIAHGVFFQNIART